MPVGAFATTAPRRRTARRQAICALAKNAANEMMIDALTADASTTQVSWIPRATSSVVSRTRECRANYM